MDYLKLLVTILLTTFLINGLVFPQDTTLTIRSDGNVGIGITNPQAPLEVANGIRITGMDNNSEGGQLTLMDGDREGGWEIDNFGEAGEEGLRFFRDQGFNNIFGLTLRSTGNVGIGLYNPSYKLDVAGKMGINNTQILYLPDQTDFTGTLIIGNGGGNLTHNYFSDGWYNTAAGINALSLNTTGYSNTAVGRNSISENTTGYSNTAVGNNSLATNTIGYVNTAVGNNSLTTNTIGYHNTAVGNNTLKSNTTGESNTAVGSNSLFDNTTGFSNTAVGNASLSANTTGWINTALGNYAGSSVTGGHNLTMIGNNAQPSSGNATDQITLGNYEITSLRCNTTTITSLSDARDKKNITDLQLGLDFITKIKPRQFNWDKREWYEDSNSDGSKMRKTPTAGFIAQELDKVQTANNAEWLNLVLKDNPDRLEATPGNLLPVMVKAIQELKKENDRLKNEIEQLKSDLTKNGDEVVQIKKIVSSFLNKEKEG